MAGKGGKRENSGRKPGKRSDERVWLARLARGHAEAAVKALVKNLEDDTGAVRNQAAKELLDRGYGRTPQEIILEEGQTDTAADQPKGLSELLGMAENAIRSGEEDDTSVSDED